MLTGMTPILLKLENSTLQNKTEVGISRHRMGLRRGNSKLAAPGRSWDNSRSGRERGNINPSVHRRKQTRTRSRIWSSDFQKK